MSFIIPIVAAVLLLAGIVWLNLSTRGRWKAHRAVQSVTLTDGSVMSNDLVMRRKVNGAWQYRAPTPEERDGSDWWHAIR